MLVSAAPLLSLKWRSSAGIHLSLCRGKAVPAKQDSIVTSSAQVTGLSGYWAKHAGKTTPSPFPLDLLLGVGYFGRKAHESIQGIKVGMWQARLVVMMCVRAGLLPGVAAALVFLKLVCSVHQQLEGRVSRGHSIGGTGGGGGGRSTPHRGPQHVKAAPKRHGAPPGPRVCPPGRPI